MKQIFVVGVAAAAAMLVGTSSASAQCVYGGYGVRSIGFGSPSIGVGYSNYTNYSYPRSTFSIGINSYPRYGVSNFSYGVRRRGHYDYHPPAVVPHRNHYHYVPGHYHYHRGRH